MTPIERLREGRLEVRQLLGPDFQKSDRDIEETLWYYYFDISKSVNYLLSMKFLNISPIYN